MSQEEGAQFECCVYKWQWTNVTDSAFKSILSHFDCATNGFEKRNLHVNTLHKTAGLMKQGHILWRKSSDFPSDVLRLLCLNSVIHGGS